MIEENVKAAVKEATKETAKKEAKEKKQKVTLNPNKDIALHTFEHFHKLGVEDREEEVISKNELDQEVLERDAAAACKSPCASDKDEEDSLDPYNK